MSRTIVVEGDLAVLLANYRAAKAVRKVASAVLDREQTEAAQQAFLDASRREEEAAIWLALCVDNREAA